MIAFWRMVRALWHALGDDGRRALAALPPRKQHDAGVILAGSFLALEAQREAHNEMLRSRSKWKLNEDGKVRPRT